jgi:membrane-associated phospholipid phosphatase
VSRYVQGRQRASRWAIARSLRIGIVAGALLACSEENTGPEPTAANSEVPGTLSRATFGWHEQARQLVGSRSFNPLAAGRVYAALAVAQYDAIDSSDDVGYDDGVMPAQGFGPGGRARFELERGAVAGASWLVLAFFFPEATVALEQRVESESKLLGSETHPQFQRGLGAGAQAASRMIARLRADHFTDPWTGTVPTGPGKWVNNGPPAAPLLGQMTPYLLLSGNQFRAAAPPSFGSAAFLTGLNEVKTISATRTADQLASAVYWNLPNGTPTPPGYWNQLANELIATHRLDERAAAHVLALVGAAVMDSFIGCWDSKYTYWFIRPSQAESAITLPIGLPNHPSYPSGHSCSSSAASTVLAYFFAGESAQLLNKVTQAGLSRIYGGIHYRFDITAGETLGRSVAEWTINQDKTAGLLSIVY